MIDQKTIENYAQKVINLAKNSITVNFRFFDGALAKYEFISAQGLNGYQADGKSFYYDPVTLLNDYATEPAFPLRLLLHVLLHGIFLHPYRFDKTEEKYWNMACDVAVENVILSMDIPDSNMLRDTQERIILARLSKWVPNLTADALYREFMVGGISKDSEKKYQELFTFDRHLQRAQYKDEPQQIITKKDWEKIAERVKAELKSFSQEMTGKETVLVNLKESTKKHYDYDEILSRFAVMSEEIKINPDEFDYIFYTYGLKEYNNMPLIEPLEYTEEKRVKEFVIAIDTSASVRGKTVEDFLNRTYDILSKSVSLSDTLNIHVIQCDSKVTEDIKIESRNQLKAIADNFVIKGFGATDFRPVFEHIDSLEKSGEIKNLKGLIYFTDGYGIYPDIPPKYDVIFAFNQEDENRMPTPPWAIKVILEEDS